ncbi:glycerate kinase [Macrococcoides caseolyticum]|uniref:glycerate kinase n=1 Tax=Macrococcoides caseolyticum TaxID=69966 RepID=UPI001F4437B5|nr:glycerate kinase [Macrococcus caseolyticus]MCE4955859.1 glycerate kinase [Macrococcus caseolyticus]
MKILIAMDSFFDKLHSHHANQYVYDGVKAADSKANIVMIPLFESDKNMIEALLVWEKGRKLKRHVSNNLLSPAIVEVAILEHDVMLIDSKSVLKSNETPLNASSYGLGQLITQGLDIGVKSFIISIGGSHTFDAGLGMLSAFGVKFYNRDYQLIDGPLKQSDLKEVRHIEMADMDNRLKDVSFTIVSDHQYKIFGKDSHIAQSQFDYETKQTIDNSIWYIAQQFKKCGIDLSASLFGGDGGALRAVFEQILNAETKTSAEVIFERTHIKQLLDEADMVIYGGGSIDETTGSLVVNEINKLQNPEKINVYLMAGKQYKQMSNDKAVIEHNIYPEIHDDTEAIQIGIQLQSTVKNILLATRKQDIEKA